MYDGTRARAWTVPGSPANPAGKPNFLQLQWLALMLATLMLITLIKGHQWCRSSTMLQGLGRLAEYICSTAYTLATASDVWMQLPVIFGKGNRL